MCLFFVILKLENWMNMCCPVVLRRTKYILEKDDRVLKKKKQTKTKSHLKRNLTFHQSFHEPNALFLAIQL